jgi:hypothetical protein
MTYYLFNFLIPKSWSKLSSPEKVDCAGSYILSHFPGVKEINTM